LWGKERTIVVTYNPGTMRKKERKFLEKLEKIREHLIEFRRKFKERKAHWKKFDAIVKRYHDLCGSLHISSKYYDLEISKDGRELSFRKNAYQVKKTMALFGRNLIVTDNNDWTTEMIVESSLDRYIVEQQFRDSKSPHHVSVNPIYHWTDCKIRCHLLACVIALTMKRLLEIKMEQAGHKISAERIIEEMRALNLITCWMPGKKKPTLHIEDPNEIQNVVLKVFGVDSENGLVLQN
jgi:transposase